MPGAVVNNEVDLLPRATIEEKNRGEPKYPRSIPNFSRTRVMGICVVATFRMIELDSFYRVLGIRAAPYKPASLPSKARVMIVFLRV